MNNTNYQTQIEQNLNSRPLKQTEYEISFGTYIYPQKKFEANLTENIYNHLIQSLFPKSKPTKSRSIIYRTKADPKQAYELYLTNNNAISLHLKKTKENKRTINLPNHSARISISTEIETPHKTKSSLPAKLSFIRYKERQSYTHKDFPNWQFDFTTGYQLSNPQQSLQSLISTPPLPTTHPKYHQFEIEYKSPKPTKTQIITDTPKLLTFIATTMPQNTIPELATIFKRQPAQLMTQVVPVSVYNVHQLKENYAVTEKADGLRLFLYITETGQLITINKANQIDIPTTPPAPVPKLKHTLFDTEYISETNEFLIFDILLHNSKQTTELPFSKRYELLQSLTTELPKNTKLKTFLEPSKTKSIYDQAKLIYQPKKYPYELDGLIFTPTNKPYQINSLKWKPIDEITIDFLVVTAPSATNKQQTELTYYVLSSRRDAKRFKLNQAPQTAVPFITSTKRNTAVVPPFPNTATVKLTNNIYKPTNTTVTNLTIIECQYDEKTQQWLPYRNRSDKTELLHYHLTQTPKEFVGANGYRTAQSNWELIQNPITKDMITGKAPLPEIYYTGTNVKNSQIKNMNQFHHYVKNYLYFTYSQKAPQPLSMIEFSGGRGGDLQTVVKLSPEQLIFTDIDKPSLHNAEQKWQRLTAHKQTKTKTTFLQTDLTKDVTAQIAPHITTPISFISMQFAFHYTLSTKTAFNNMFKNMDTFLQPKGIIILTTFDGETIANLLKSNKSVAMYSNTNSTRLLFKITKDYKNSNSPFGKKITVFGETIGEHPEYVVDYKHLIDHFTKHNYKVLETAMFTHLLSKWQRKTNKTLTQPEQNFSKLNRYIVFQKL